MPNPQSFTTLRRLVANIGWIAPVAVVLLGLISFAWQLPAEPHFVDESAYISQSFYADLWWSGRWDDPTWLTYGGYDLPPLPKYVIGLAMALDGHPRPGPAAMMAWYRNTNVRFVSRRGLIAARCPSALFGVVGCLAVYAIGSMAWDRRLGLAASLLLMVNPLYSMHARRAMSDVPAEALILATLAVGLWGGKQILTGKRVGFAVIGLVFGSGLLAGLATLAKLNGALGGLILGAWAGGSIVLTRFTPRARGLFLSATLTTGLVAFATFATMNPFLFAQPRPPIDPRIADMARLGFLDRVKVVKDHRVDVSREGQKLFPKDALKTPREKLQAVAVQGFGRFGPFGPRGRTDSTVRFAWSQDGLALIWMPWVLAGLVIAMRFGNRQYRQGLPPVAWAVVAQSGVALIVVTAFIPLAWDRYYLSIQPGFALLGGFAVIALMDGSRRFLSARALPESNV